MEDHGCQEGGGQEGEEGGRKGKCARDEEEGRWHFRAQGPFAGVGDHLRWEEDGAHGGYEEDLGLHQEKQPQSGPHDQAGFHPEGHLPGGEHRHAQDGRLRQQAPVVSPWGEPRRFSRRVPTSRRALESRPHEFDSCLLTSATLLELSPGYPCMLFGAAARPARRDAATTATVVAVFKILIFRNFKRFEDVNRGTVWPKKKKKKKKKKFSGLIPLLKKKKKKKS